MMTLGEKQRLFCSLVAKLIAFAYDIGYEMTFGEAYRTPEQAQANAVKGTGISNSLHTKRLAIDLNLFYNKVYLQRTEEYEELGDYWKSLHPLCCWGGDFKKPDGNHFSLEHEGVR
jgi:hypothetical protein